MSLQFLFITEVWKKKSVTEKEVSVKPTDKLNLKYLAIFHIFITLVVG